MIGKEDMTQYYVEGLYANKQGVKKKLKNGTYSKRSIEPYARTIWANSPQEALQIATSELEGGEWIEGPRLSQVTEEQRMRSLGAPEFPGLAKPPSKSFKHR
jgi:hypothetical protein